MINACHMLLAYPSLLMGERLVHEGMRDPRIIALLTAFLDKDVIPFVDPAAGRRPRRVQSDDHRALLQSRDR